MTDEFVTPLTGVDIEKPLKIFTAEFNDYRDGYNKSARQQNILTTFGYFLAFLTALFSMYLCKKETTKTYTHRGDRAVSSGSALPMEMTANCGDYGLNQIWKILEIIATDFT
jgi:hypothetical protein